MRLAIIGLGQMGMPMLERLRAAGHDVGFWARRPEAIDRARAAGAVPIAELGDRDAVIICVYADEQVHDVAPLALASMPRGATLVLHTTSSPATVDRLVELARLRAVAVLDAALSGGPADVAAGSLTLLVGGERDVLQRVRPALAAYADPIIPVGRVGDGQRVKLLNNALLGAQTALVADAERVAIDLGLDPAVALDAIQHCSGDSRALRFAVSAGGARRFDDAAGRFIRKDVAVARAVADDAGVDLGRLGTPWSRLEDVEAIKQLKARYFRFIDTKDWGAFRDLFTDDCKHLLPQEASVPYMSNDEYLPMMQATLDRGVTTHHGHMPEITFTSPTEAEGIWAMSDYVQTESDRGRVSIKGWGYYYETYRRCEDGAWRISSKRNERLRLDQVPWTRPEDEDDR
jgi:3-hydroxyisobutyrate dehydrogenase-like beta-hydroxyacid dehydrogenase